MAVQGSIQTGMVRIPIADTGLVVTMIIPRNGVWQYIMRRERKNSSWATIMSIMQRYYRSMGEELQLLVVEEYAKSVKRPDVSTGRLEKATLNEANYDSTKDGFSIGVPSYLNRSDAKYWRQIEHGYSGHVGRQIRGGWSSALGGKRIARSGAVYYSGAGREFTGFGDATGQKFQPFFTGMRIARKHKVAMKPGATKRERPKKSSSGGKIDRPIEAQDAYTRAFLRFRKTNRPFQIFRSVVAEELGIDRRQVPGSYQKIVDNLL